MKIDKKDLLLKNEMEDLRFGGSILTHDWLGENNFTIDDAECLAESIAHSVNIYNFDEKHEEKI